jgi:Holliday junction DNA helicase RuvA
MIGKLKGTLSEIENNKGLIETASGVFYEVFLTPDLLQTPIGEFIEVFTYLQVREDSLTLYGFTNKNQNKLFNMLLAVDGVGPKSAFSIIAYSHGSQIIDAVLAGNVEYFSGIPGVGKKTAQKILLELSHKISKDFDMSSLAITADDKLFIDALGALGFHRNDIQSISGKLDKTLSIEEQIKEAIKLLSNR